MKLIEFVKLIIEGNFYLIIGTFISALMYIGIFSLMFKLYQGIDKFFKRFNIRKMKVE